MPRGMQRMSSPAPSEGVLTRCIACERHVIDHEPMDSNRAAHKGSPSFPMFAHMISKYDVARS